MTLFVNCCPRDDSRTLRIAKAYLSKQNAPYEELMLYKENPKPLTPETLAERTALVMAGELSHPMFRYARQFANADRIVIAAPFWDLSFPAMLKNYIENIYVTGIVSKYGPDGMPVGLCKADKLVYITTAGGPYQPEYSYGYFSTMATEFFGIGQTRLIKAEMLDVEGFDAELILNDVIETMTAQ